MMDAPLLSPSPSYQQVPATAASAQGYLVVWNDSRNAFKNGNGPRYDLYGAHIDLNGAFLDPVGFLIHESASPHWPAVASDGTNYLVVWSPGDDSEIFGAMVSATGSVTGVSGFPITSASGSQLFPALTWDGGQYVVVWQDGRTNINFHEIYGARVLADGTILDPQGIPIRLGTNDHAGARVASTGTEALVVWSEWNPFGSPAHFGVFGARIGRNGKLLDSAPIVFGASTGQYHPAVVAASAGAYLVVWGGSGIFAARVTSTGTVLDPSGSLISAQGNSPEAVGVGSDFYLTWLVADSIFGSRVLDTGSAIHTNGVLLSNLAASRLALATSGGSCLAVWEHRASQLDIYGLLVDPLVGVPILPEFPISTEFNQQFQPTVAFNGTNYLVVWRDNRTVGETAVPCCFTSGPNSIYGTRVSTRGEILDATAVRVSLADSTSASDPTVASDGSNFLVLWRKSHGNSEAIVGTRVTGSGLLLDTNALLVGTGNYGRGAPAVAWNGENYITVWQDLRDSVFMTESFTRKQHIYGAAVSQAGNVQNFVVSTGSDNEWSPAVAAIRNDVFVVWWQGDVFGNVTIQGLHLDGSGAIIGTPVALSSTLSGSAVDPSIAASSSEWLVVWAQRGTAGYDVVGTRVRRDGSVIDPRGFDISTAPADQVQPSVSYSDGTYFVVWQDARNGGSTGNDLYGTRVTTNGVVLDTSGLLINTLRSNKRMPSVATGTPNTFFVAAEGVVAGLSRAVGYLARFDAPIIDTVNLGNGQATLSWIAQPNRTYRLQFVDDLDARNWSDLAGDVIATDGSASKADTTVRNTSQRFYRVVRLP